MDINIRKYILNNFKDDSINELKEAIETSISSNDEVVLPGLGVLFQVMWENSDADTKDKILNIIYESIKKAD